MTAGINVDIRKTNLDVIHRAVPKRQGRCGRSVWRGIYGNDVIRCRVTRVNAFADVRKIAVADLVGFRGWVSRVIGCPNRRLRKSAARGVDFCCVKILFTHIVRLGLREIGQSGAAETTQ